MSGAGQTGPCENGDMDEAEKLRTALQLHDDGVALMRENLRRRHPDASHEDIEAQLLTWLRTRPGAEYGDSAGTPRSPSSL